jgi:hypothetical protein
LIAVIWAIYRHDGLIASWLLREARIMIKENNLPVTERAKTANP